MSCDSLTQQSINLNVSFGSLPEGFCPASMQDLGAAIAARLLITPNAATSSFAIGSIAPTSNVGPWLKDCLEWFVFDDATATYIPITKGGFDSMTYLTSSGDFVVPVDVFKLKVHAWGAGGGGGFNTGAVGGTGGGGGGFGINIFNVLPGQVIPVTVGMGGAGGGPGGTGGSTSFLTLVATGGTGGDQAAVIGTGQGGTVTGATFSIIGGQGTKDYVGNFGGTGGHSGQGGSGGTSNQTTAANQNGKSPGGGGSGATNGLLSGAPGAGASGGVLIEY